MDAGKRILIGLLLIILPTLIKDIPELSDVVTGWVRFIMVIIGLRFLLGRIIAIIPLVLAGLLIWGGVAASLASFGLSIPVAVSAWVLAGFMLLIAIIFFFIPV